MIGAIRSHLARGGSGVDGSGGGPGPGKNEVSKEMVIASAYRSLAWSYRTAVTDLEKLTGAEFGKVHIVGGAAETLTSTR